MSDRYFLHKCITMLQLTSSSIILLPFISKNTLLLRALHQFQIKHYRQEIRGILPPQRIAYRRFRQVLDNFFKPPAPPLIIKMNFFFSARFYAARKLGLS